MVQSCAALNCKIKAKKGSGISFHKFPLGNPELLKRWVLSVNRKDLKPTRHLRICSHHFTPDSFWENYKTSRQLKPDAVPTLFDFKEDNMFKEIVPLSKENLNNSTYEDFPHNKENLNNSTYEDFPHNKENLNNSTYEDVPQSKENLNNSNYNDISLCSDRLVSPDETCAPCTDTALCATATSFTGPSPLKETPTCCAQTTTSTVNVCSRSSDISTCCGLTSTPTSSNKTPIICSTETPTCISEATSGLIQYVADCAENFSSDTPTCSTKTPTSTTDGSIHNGRKRKSTEAIAGKHNKLRILPSDHPYFIKDSPRTVVKKYKKHINRKDEVILRLRKKLAYQNSKCKRKEKQICTLRDLLEALKAKNFVNERIASIMNECFSEVTLDLLKRISSNSKAEYPNSLKSFALTLYFYSPCAYEYVRTTLDYALPHVSTVRRWLSSIDGKPGFTQEALFLIQEKISKLNYNVYFNVTLDEMSIKKKIEWDNTQFIGYVDRGAGIETVEKVEAREVLVVLAVGINVDMKIPIGYFLVNGISAEDKRTIVDHSLRLLHNINATCTSITFDGLQSNITMTSLLGANLDAKNMKSYFPHPVTKENFYVFLDVCHMIKLVRNLFSDLGCLIDMDGKEIKWEYIKKLDELQHQEGLLLANKLRTSHIHYHKQKMKVKLAVQVLSSSVSTSLNFLREDLHLLDFQHSEATANFCSFFDKLFDVGNSKSTSAKGYKSVLRKSNRHLWEPFFAHAEKYLLGLKDNLGRNLYTTSRKTPIIGFLCLLSSLKALFNDLVVTEKLKYIMTYKFSQDHIEMFFCMIRSRFGWNNNPSALQFRSAYRQLLIRNDLRPKKTGNCTDNNSVPLLSWVKDMQKKSNYFDPVVFSESHRYDIECTDDMVDDVECDNLPIDHDYVCLPTNLSEYSNNIVVYIAGFVVRRVQDKIKCLKCVSRLFSDEDTSPYTAFCKRKNNGGLIFPSRDVIKICTETEKILRVMLAENGGKPPQGNVSLRVQSKVGQKLYSSNLFDELKEHVAENLFPLNHIDIMVKAIVKIYMNVRFHHVANSYSLQLHKSLIRQHLNKSVLFYNQ